MQMSGEMSVSRRSSVLLSRMRKSEKPLSSSENSTSISSIAASLGARTGNSSTKRSSAPRSPSSSSSTPDEVFLIVPRSSSSRTSLCTKGRKPTPCTIPRICIHARFTVKHSPLFLSIRSVPRIYKRIHRHNDYTTVCVFRKISLSISVDIGKSNAGY